MTRKQTVKSEEREMLPKPMPELRGKEAERFIKYDQKPLTPKEKQARARSIKVYNSISPRRK